MCQTIVQQGGRLKLPEQEADLPLFAEIVLDAANLSRVGRGDPAKFTLGDIRSFGDEAVATKIRTRIGMPDQFGDVMLELTLAAWHIAEGHQVTPLERDGWPDISVQVPGVDRPVYVECKRLTSVGAKTLKNRINKANKQLRAVDHRNYGTMVIDVAASVGTNQSSDEPPPAVQTVLDAAQNIISGPKNRAVGRIVVTWLGTDIRQNGALTTVFLTRHIAQLDHGAAERLEPLPPLNLFAGQTMVLALVKTPRGSA